MDTETIDLTDPLEEILKQTNWTAESLNEKLTMLGENNSNLQEKMRQISLEEKPKNLSCIETIIELSDNDDDDYNDEEAQIEYDERYENTESATEVHVIQVKAENEENYHFRDDHEDDNDEDDEDDVMFVEGISSISNHLNKSQEGEEEEQFSAVIKLSSDGSFRIIPDGEKDKEDVTLVTEREMDTLNYPSKLLENKGNKIEESSKNTLSFINPVYTENEEKNLDYSPKTSVIVNKENINSQQTKNDSNESLESSPQNSPLCIENEEETLKSPVHKEDITSPQKENVIVESLENAICIINSVYTENKVKDLDTESNLNCSPKTNLVNTECVSSPQKENGGDEIRENFIRILESANTEKEPENLKTNVNLNYSLKSPVYIGNSSSPQKLNEIDKTMKYDICHINSENEEKNLKIKLNSKCPPKFPLIEEIIVSQQNENNRDLSQKNANSVYIEKTEDNLKTNLNLNCPAKSPVIKESIFSQQKEINTNNSSNNVNNCFREEDTLLLEGEQCKKDNLYQESIGNGRVADIANDYKTLSINNVAGISERKNKFSEKIIISEDDESKQKLSNLEEIRNNIRLQLTSLKRGKKVDFIKDVQQKINNIDKTDSLFNKRPFYNTNHKVDTVSTIEKIVPVATKTKLTNNVSDSQEDIKVSNAISELRKIIRKPKTSSKKDAAIDVCVEQTPNKTGNEKFDLNNEIQIESENSQQDSDFSNALRGIRNIIGSTKHTEKYTNIEQISTEKIEKINLEAEKKDINNPFVSNSLDEFLTDSKLNVSYAIPKSGAEEGLKRDYNLDPIMLVDPHTVKEDEEGSKIIKKGVVYKPKTLAEKRRIFEKNKLKEEQRIKKMKIKEELECRSYVMFKNKKIYLNSKSTGKCLAYVESDLPQLKQESEIPKNAKPSLLKEFYKKTFSPIKYRPGPLSKKHTLQSDYSQWTTELKSLPKVTLNIMPEFRKPVHKNLIGIVNNQWKGEIIEDQIEFALSALKSEEKQTNIFKFDLNYEKNQKSILVRKKIPDEKFELKSIKNTVNNSSNSENPDKVVAQVIENLLNYVEINEIASTLIKEDEDFVKENESIINTNQKFVKKKCSKTNRELLRLNCKVVTMDQEENEENIKCSKSFCRLGCLCNSLKCESMIGLHCQKAKCIFGCNCPKELNKVLSVSNKLLSSGNEFLTTDTVIRIEDEAKKNLAKEEKDFTQTVICTNDKTIVVGMGVKQRRAAKTPKKYSDFFDEDIFEDNTKEVKKKKARIPILPCDITLETWDFSDIIPYCMVHYLHNCHCNGFSSFDKKPSVSESSDTNNSENYSTFGRQIRKKPFNNSDYIYKGGMQKEIHPEPPESFTSARTSKIHNRYFSKKRIITDAIFAEDFVNNITQADVFKAKLQSGRDDILESEFLKCIIIDEKRLAYGLSSRGLTTQSKGHQRKQQLKVREDEDLNIEIKGSKKVSKKLKRKSNDNIKNTIKKFQESYPTYGKKPKLQENKKQLSKGKPVEKIIPDSNDKQLSEEKLKVESVFAGEIIVNDSDWLKKMCNNTQQPLNSYARILPWPALLKGFILKSINVCCIWDSPLRLILNTGEKLKGPKFLDVETQGHIILKAKLIGSTPGLLKQSENVRDIIKWLLSASISSKYSKTSLSFLLVESQPGQFEVRGFCTQKSTEDGVQSIQKNDEDSTHASELTEIKHKNMYNQVMSLFITKSKFKSRELVEDGCDDDLKDNLYMWVGLPEVYKKAKWRVIFLRNDFMYLYLKAIKYSIKYTDIVKLTEIATEENVTLMVRNLDIRRSYGHSLYGLYISPKYSDRIFIGPYYLDYEEEDVDTLIYRNQSLISNSSLNKMKGITNYKCGSWMYERQTQEQNAKSSMPETIDLTEEDTLKMSPCTLSTTSIEKKTLPRALMSMPDEIIYHNNLPVHILNSKPRSPREFNRFIITNIPHFGYLGAYQPGHSPILEVSWPFEKKVLRFENADHARDFLQERFNQLLQPVPETFKIQVIVLLHLDLKEHNPINSDFLSGHCICGYFGTYNFKEITDEFCQKELKMSKQDITKLFYKRAREYIRQKLIELAALNNMSITKDINVDTILNKAKEEIKIQEHKRIQNIAEIQLFENILKSNAKRLFELIKDLPHKERNLESKIMNETLRIRPAKIKATNDIIEIADDDDIINRPSTSGISSRVSAPQQRDSLNYLPRTYSKIKPPDLKKKQQKYVISKKDTVTATDSEIVILSETAEVEGDVRWVE